MTTTTIRDTNVYMDSQRTPARTHSEVIAAIRQWAKDIWAQVPPEKQATFCTQMRKHALVNMALSTMPLLLGALLLWWSWGKDNRGVVAHIGQDDLVRLSNTWIYPCFVGLCLLLLGIGLVVYFAYRAVDPKHYKLWAMTRPSHIRKHNPQLYKEYMAAPDPKGGLKVWIAIGAILAIVVVLGVVASQLG